MPVCKDIGALVPNMQPKVRAMLQEAKAHPEQYPWILVILETRRSAEVQQAYYSVGRDKYEETCRLYDRAGLGYHPSSDECKRTITGCDGIRHQSRHQNGKAVDIAPLNPADGKVWWSAPDEVWSRIGELAENNGLDWCAGGSHATWGKGWDKDHFEDLEDIDGNPL